jgi:hypothetical protein
LIDENFNKVAPFAKSDMRQRVKNDQKGIE